ncbi:MAG: acyltransferase [Actinobacteria bacterium]|nr:acyltransferase [Actinomycetota bacterium]
MAGPANSTRLTYEPALDGLRAVAVVAVLLYHDQSLDFARGGFLGVDVFFVLSGFLITTILLGDHARRGRTVSVGFWVRRIRRLLPAFLLMMLLVAVFAVFVPGPTDGDELRRAGLGALLYGSNWQQAYWSNHIPTLVSHTWSLSIEEQWYVVWPFLLGGLLWLSRGGTRVLAILIGVLAIASAVWMSVLFHSGADLRAFFGTDARAWELLAGALFAVVLMPEAQRPARTRTARVLLEVGAVSGLITMLGAFVVFRDDDAWLYPGGRVLLVVGVMLVLAGVCKGSSAVVRPLLAWRPFVWIGLVSYGVYLFHVPIFGWLSPERVGLDGTALLLVRIVVLLAFATASFVLLENPIRRGAPLPVRTSIALPVALAAVAGMFLVSTVFARQEAIAVLALPHYRELAATTPAGARRVLVVGDAAASQLGELVPTPLDRGGIRGAVASGCEIAGGTPVVGNAPLRVLTCPPWRSTFREAVDAFDPDVVVLMTGTMEPFDRMVDGRVLRVGTPELARHLERRLEEVRRLTTGDGRRLLLLTLPCADPGPQHEARWAEVRGDQRRVEWVNEVWGGFAASHAGSVGVVDLGAVLCPNGNARATFGGADLRPDGFNLSAQGATTIWDWLAAVTAAEEGQRARSR